MTENIKKLQELLNCEVIPVTQNTDPRQLVETYLNLWPEYTLDMLSLIHI